jgi:cytochrome P450
LELSISLPALYERFPKIEISEEPRRRESFVLRGFEKILCK